MFGVAEKNHRAISSVPVVYTAGLHDSESGEGHIVQKKRSGLHFINNVLIKTKKF